MAAVEEVEISFRASPGVTHIEQSLPRCMSFLVLGDDDDPELKIVGVRVNGAPRRIYQWDDRRVSVSPPIPFEFDRVSIICVRPSGPMPSGAVLREQLDPTKGYGLQAPGAITRKGAT